MDNELQPYKGLVPFEKKDQSIFFGRDREKRELLSLVVANNTVLLYSKSGLGKTSLVNAGLIPLIIEKKLFEILPHVRIFGAIQKGIDYEEISNIFIFNTLINFDEDNTNPQRLVNMSLTNFLKEWKIKRTPNMPRIIIFDQFEEFFSLYQERWRERRTFFEQIAIALEDDPLLRIIFIIREEYLAQLDPYASLMPERFRIRFRLEGLREEAALLAIKKPLEKTNRSFAKDVAEELVKDLLKIPIRTEQGKLVIEKGEFAEPVQLQLVCQKLWRNLPSNVTTITPEHVQKFGDVNQALQSFYEQTIEIAKTTGFDEEESPRFECDLRIWFHYRLITAAGTRGTVCRGEKQTEGIPNATIELLEDRHIIRAEFRAGARWYELIHDRLIEPIRKSNYAYFYSLGVEEEHQRAERQLNEAKKKHPEEKTRDVRRLRWLTAQLSLASLIAVASFIYALLPLTVTVKLIIVSLVAITLAVASVIYALRQRKITHQQAIKFSEGFFEAGRNLAISGNIEGAVAIFRHAMKLGINLNLDPEREAQRFAALGLIAKGEVLAEEGKIKEAIAAYKKAQSLDPEVEISADSWNTLGWYGILFGSAADVRFACDRAVELDTLNYSYRNNSGIARAITGDYKGAIKDFEFYIEWGQPREPEESIRKRKAWLKELKTGRNPFDEATLKALRNE